MGTIGTFMDIVGARYKDIKCIFKSRSFNNNIDFDEDIFNDTFIKCVEKFGNKEIDYETTVKYFWTAYINGVRTVANAHMHDIVIPLNEEIHDCIDEDTDCDYEKQLYKTVMEAVTVKFGEDNMQIYSLYKYHNWTEDELIMAGYDCNNLSEKIKTIHKFVKAYCKKNIK